MFSSEYFKPVPGSFVATLQSQMTSMLTKVTLRHKLMDVTLGANGVAVVDLSSLGYTDFEVIPQVTIVGTAISNLRLMTGTASAKDVSGTNRKVTITGRRLKVAGAVTDLLTGLMEAAANGDVVSVLVIEKTSAA